MKKIFTDFKTLIAELVGLIGGGFWAKSSNWDYEPLILVTISFASLCLTIYFELFGKQMHKELSINPSEIENPISNLDAKKIINELDNAAPFQTNQLKSNYKDFRIKWEVVLESVHNTVGDDYIIMTLYKGNYPWVNFTVNINKYPNFKIAKKKDRYLITGKIKIVGGNDFTIDLEEIQQIN